MISTKVLKHLTGAREGERVGNKGDVRSDCQRSVVGMSGSLRGRRSEEMTLSNISLFPSRCGQKYLLNPRKADGS